MDVQQINLRDMNWAEQIRNDDKQAFSNLFDTYYKSLCEYVYRFVRREELMEDIVQEVFVRLWEKRHNWRPNVAVRAYLYRSVYHQAINEYRKKRFEFLHNEDRINDIIDNGSSPLNEVHYQEMLKVYRKAIDSLPKRRKEILILRLVHGLSYKKIGSVLGISVNTVDTQIRRALNLFRKELRYYAPENELANVE